MATEKILNTRVQLKYDSYANWDAVKATFKPLKGEICIVNPGTKLNDATTTPCLMKVGDGTNFFKDLQWVSAIAADVYAWAKKPAPDWADFPALPIEVVDNGTGKFVTGFTYADNKLTITRADVNWGDVKNAPDFALAADLGNVTTLTTTEKTAVGAINEHDVEIGNLTSLNTTNKGNLVAAINETLQAVEVGGTGSVVTVTKQENPTTGSEATYVVNQGGKAVDVKIEIPKYDTSADYGVLEVNGDAQSGVEVDTTDAQKPIVKIKANTYDAYGAAASVQQSLTEYENAHKDDYTNSKIDELVDAVEDKVEAIKVPVYSVTKDATPGAYSAVYHLTRDGEIVGEAINIPKDMVVQSGEVVENPEGQPAGTYIKLVLQNVTDPLYINVGDLIEYVTSGSTKDSQVIIDIDANHKVTATIGAGKVGTTEIANGAVTKAKLAKEVTDIIDSQVGKITQVIDDTVTKGIIIDRGNSGHIEADLGDYDEYCHDLVFNIKKGVITKDMLAPGFGTEIDNKKDKQTAVGNQITKAAHVISSLTQNENGNITYDVKELIPADIGAKSVQTPVANKFDSNYKERSILTSLTQNENGEISYEISELTLASIKGFTVNSSSISQNLTDISGAEGVNVSLNEIAGSDDIVVSLVDKGVTTAKIADHAVGAHQTKACKDYTDDDAEVWVFDCGSATVNV